MLCTPAAPTRVAENLMSCEATDLRTNPKK